ncbi:hypothetical protein AB1Y20_009012 [Prymnesium parvum]|uniref:Uncharacterized protein n=1 Tax=Prymnesium parvum TaxID=97485 RepID=A0AB34K3T5_PRYPA
MSDRPRSAPPLYSAAMGMGTLLPSKQGSPGVRSPWLRSQGFRHPVSCVDGRARCDPGPPKAPGRTHSEVGRQAPVSAWPVSRLESLLMQPKLSDVTSRVILPVPALLESNTSSDAINGRRPQLVERPAAGFQAGIRRMERAARGSNSRVVEILQDSSHEFPPACKVGQAWIRKPSDAELTQTSGTSPNCAAAPQAAFASFDLTGDTDQIPDCSPNRLPFPQETCAKAKRLPFHQEAPARVQDSQVARSSEEMKPVDEGGDADEVLTAHPEEELNDVLEWENRVRQDFAKEAKELAKKVYAMVSAQGKLPLAQRLPIAPPFAIAKLLFTLPLFRGSAPFHRAWGWCVKAASGAMLRHGRRYQRLYTQEIH